MKKVEVITTAIGKIVSNELEIDNSITVVNLEYESDISLSLSEKTVIKESISESFKLDVTQGAYQKFKSEANAITIGIHGIKRNRSNLTIVISIEKYNQTKSKLYEIDIDFLKKIEIIKYEEIIF